jgi:hypothetical protein
LACLADEVSMLHDHQRLRDDANLLRLLAHYAGLIGEDRLVWLDRLMALECCDAATLARLHGELIAGDWLEINVGSPSGKRPGAVECSYRVTAAGLRAYRHVQSGAADDDEGGLPPLAEVQPAKGPPRARRGKKPAAPPPQAA